MRKKKAEGEPLTFSDCMQIGLGQLRLSPAAFYAMTYEEFIMAVIGMHKQEETRQRAEWERTRWAAAVSLMPHSKKGHKVKPTDLAIFPWERKQKKNGDNKAIQRALNRMKDG